MLATVPVASVARVDVISVKQYQKEVARGGEAFLALLRPSDNSAIMGMCSVSEGGQAEALPDRFEALLKEFSDVFDQPTGLPSRAIEHHIELLPGSEPPAKC